MTRIYLAVSTDLKLRGLGPEYPWDTRPLNLLVSFAYLQSWRKWTWVKPSSTILDSGAYSAWKSGRWVDIEALTNETRNPAWSECVALDVIGDPAASFRNALAMQAAGSRAYPVFHFGDPWEHLIEYRKAFPKIGLSCKMGEGVAQSLRWLDGCFARAWPHRFHSFGWVEEAMLDRFPFESADTASWERNPASMGRWKFLGKPKREPRSRSEFRSHSRPLGTRGVTNLRAEVEYYLRLQDYLAFRWRTQLAELTPALAATT